MTILDLIKQEHMSLANEMSARVTETHLKETYLHLNLEESIENEDFLKQQNNYVQNELKKAKKKLIQSTAACEEVKENLAILHDKLQTEQKASFSARNELSNIVSCLHRFTGLPHVQHGIKGMIFQKVSIKYFKLLRKFKYITSIFSCNILALVSKCGRSSSQSYNIAARMHIEKRGEISISFIKYLRKRSSNVDRNVQNYETYKSCISTKTL